MTAHEIYTTLLWLVALSYGGYLLWLLGRIAADRLPPRGLTGRKRQP